MTEIRQAVISSTHLKGTRRTEMALACLKTVLSLYQVDIADSQYNTSQTAEKKTKIQVTK
jgi:hypothetical protein